MIEAQGSFWLFIAILFGVCLLMSSIGFNKFVYFLSVGYGLSVFGLGVALILFTSCSFSFSGITGNGFVNYILGAILILYGIRLSSFLIYRELKSASYRKTMEKVSGKEEKTMPFFVKRRFGFPSASYM